MGRRRHGPRRGNTQRTPRPRVPRDAEQRGSRGAASTDPRRRQLGCDRQERPGRRHHARPRQDHLRAARPRPRALRPRRSEDQDPEDLLEGRVGRGRDRGTRPARERQAVRQPLRVDLRDPRRQDLRDTRVHGYGLHPGSAGRSMTEAYDIVTIGSGHNGLVAAAYLAAAGKRVLVLERNPWFGGGVVTRELTVPGFLHDQHSIAHIFIHGNQLLSNDELGLKSRHGLRYVFPNTPMMSVFEDGSTLSIHRDRERTCTEIAKYSKKDADAYRRLAEEAAGYLPMVLAGLYSPPTPLGATYALMDQSREGRELWRIMQMSMHDLLAERFEHPRVRMHFARIAGENLVSPDEKATGFGVFVFVGFLEAYGIGVPIGGSGSLTNALIASIKEHGGDV